MILMAVVSVTKVNVFCNGIETWSLLIGHMDRLKVTQRAIK